MAERIDFFDEINKNKRNSVIITVLFVLFVVAMGYILGIVWGSPIGGMIISAIICLIYTIVVFSFGDEIVLSSNHAKEATKADYPYLINTVEGLAIAAGIPQPKCYVIQDNAINAFATGKSPEKSYIAVTTGCLKKLNRQELEGVIAHEMSHIKNYDIRLTMVVIVLIGTLMILSDIMLRSFIFSGNKDEDRGQLGLILMVVGIVLAILSPIIGELIRLAISRKREYLADASGAMLTRNPSGLADALKKIQKDTVDTVTANKGTASMYFSSPFRKGLGNSLWSTHPPIQERIKRLENM